MSRLLHLVIVLAFLLPSAAMAGDDLPKRLFAEPPGVRTLDPTISKPKPTGNFVMGYQPRVEVTGEPPMTIDKAFMMKAHEKWPGCDVERICGSMAYIDCGSEMDGPAYYINGKTFETIATCGGACMNPAVPCDCPPKEWNCNQTEEGTKP